LLFCLAKGVGVRQLQRSPQAGNQRFRRLQIAGAELVEPAQFLGHVLEADAPDKVKWTPLGRR